MPLDAVIFDVEGTLVDCVPHVLESWGLTLADAGHNVARDVLQRYSGMDGGDMLGRLLPEASRAEKKNLLEAQGERYRGEFLHRARPFYGVRNLLESLKKQRIRLAVATTCKGDELKSYDKRLQVLSLLDAVTCGDDVSKGKPHPDLFRHALRKLSLTDASRCMAAGDTPYDAQAAKALGIHVTGVLTGGFSRAELIASGCDAVVNEVQDLERALAF